MKIPDWQTIDKLAVEIPDSFRNWLLHTGSFMERLKQHGVSDARVEVISEEWRLPNPGEIERLQLSAGLDCLVREVLIRNDTAIWMYARTILPPAILTGELHELAHLKDRSLGSILFKNPAMRRGEFEIVYLDASMELYQKVNKQLQQELPNLWARRSIFTSQEKSLLLTEVFLPNIDVLR